MLSGLIHHKGEDILRSKVSSMCPRLAHEEAESARLAQQEKHRQHEEELAAARKELEAIRAEGEVAAEAARLVRE